MGSYSVCGHSCILIVQIALFLTILIWASQCISVSIKMILEKVRWLPYFNKENLTNLAYSRKNSIFLYNVKSKQQRSKMHFGRKCRKVNVTPVSSVYITRYNFYVTFITEIVGQYCKTIIDLLRVLIIFVAICLKIIDQHQSYLQINVKSCI